MIRAAPQPAGEDEAIAPRWLVSAMRKESRSNVTSVDLSGGLLRKVLVVDDEPDLADLAVALLGAHAVDAAVAYSAHEALQVLETDKEIDAVVSDVMMPGMTGLQLADAVREMYPGVKIILVSGYMHASLLVGRERQYLFATKPYQINTILGLLHS